MNLTDEPKFFLGIYLINEKINDIKDQIDLRAESLKNEIDIQRLKLFQKLEYLENKIKNYEKTRSFYLYKMLLNNNKSKCDDYGKTKTKVVLHEFTII